MYLLIKNGTVHNGLGKTFAADILCEDGIIKMIDKNITAPEGAEVYDAAGQHVFPGFIDPATIWGSFNAQAMEAMEATDPVTPQAEAIYGFGWETVSNQEGYRHGVTTVGISPGNNNVFGGQACAITAWGRHPFKMVLKEKTYMAAAFNQETKKAYGEKGGPKTTMGIAAIMKSTLRKATDYMNKGDKREYDQKMEALLPVVKGELPLMVTCSTSMEMDAVRMIMAEYPQIKVGYMVAFEMKREYEEIASGKAPVFLGNMSGYEPGFPTVINFDEILYLARNGARIAISTADTGRMFTGREHLIWNACLLRKKGLEADIVLKMMTSIPAEILGIDDKVGSIREGLRADIVVWSHDPLETFQAAVQKCWIGGKVPTGNDGRYE